MSIDYTACSDTRVVTTTRAKKIAAPDVRRGDDPADMPQGRAGPMMFFENRAMMIAINAICPMGPIARMTWKIPEMSIRGSLMMGSSQSALAGWSKNGIGEASKGFSQ
jgi:hypothetical protein